MLCSGKTVSDSDKLVFVDNADIENANNGTC